MNNRLKIICILFATTYLFTLGKLIGTGYYSFIAGVNEGMKQVESGVKMDICHSTLKPLKGTATFPSLEQNLITGQTLNFEIREMMAKVDSSAIKIPRWIAVFQDISLFLSFLIIIVMVYIPIQIYRVIKFIVKDEIFDMKNIKRIRKIGYALLILFGSNSIIEWSGTQLTKQLIAIEGYTSYFEFDATILLFGLVVLLFAEIFNIAQKIKEEQDFTI